MPFLKEGPELVPRPDEYLIYSESYLGEGSQENSRVAPRTSLSKVSVKTKSLGCSFPFPEVACQKKQDFENADSGRKLLFLLSSISGKFRFSVIPIDCLDCFQI